MSKVECNAPCHDRTLLIISLKSSSGSCGCSHITWVAYEITTYSDADAVKIFFLGLNYADHGGVGDLFASITGDVFVINDKEGIRAFNALDISVYSLSYTFEEASHLVGK